MSEAENERKWQHKVEESRKRSQEQEAERELLWGQKFEAAQQRALQVPAPLQPPRHQWCWEHTCTEQHGNSVCLLPVAPYQLAWMVALRVSSAVVGTYPPG